MAYIFISYRRKDTAIWADRLGDALREEFPGRVFMDIREISPGLPWRTVLDAALNDCTALLVVIGPGWASAADADGKRRLADERDTLRREVAEALRRGVRVFPLLVNGADMPSAEALPDDLKDLADLQGHDLTVKHWREDVAKLIALLKRVSGLGGAPVERKPATEPASSISEKDAAEKARREAEAEALRKQEEARRAAEMERQRQAEEEARREAEEERRRKAEQQAREEAQRRSAEADRRKAEEEARRKEEEARRDAEAARQRNGESQAARDAAAATSGVVADAGADRPDSEARARNSRWLWVGMLVAVIGLPAGALIYKQAQRQAAIEETRKAAEQAADAEKQRQAEEAKRRKAEEAARRTAEEAKRKAAEQAEQRAALQAQRLAAEEADRKAKEKARKDQADAERKAAQTAAALPLSLRPKMVKIPAGSFEMGERRVAEPVHRVTFARPFYLGATEVTFAQYDAFCKAPARPCPDDRGWGRGDRPVIGVGWNDARSYANWLGTMTGTACRLPSEAEWEYVARAGTTMGYPWGDEPGSGKANFRDSVSQWSGKQTAPVASFPPNRWGLYDTSGNVWEWVEDCWHANYQGVPDDGRAWLEKDRAACVARVLRGGSWFNDADSARSVARYFGGPDNRSGDVGFRVLCSSPIE